jgi:hypothetical protein
MVASPFIAVIGYYRENQRITLVLAEGKIIGESAAKGLHSDIKHKRLINKLPFKSDLIK